MVRALASGGDDWFFRLRRGDSDWESFTVYAKESEDGEVKAYDMTLVGNHIWRGFCPSRTALEGGLYVRIAGRNRQTPGSTEYDLNMSRYSLAGNAGALPDISSPTSKPSTSPSSFMTSTRSSFAMFTAASTPIFRARSRTVIRSP